MRILDVLRAVQAQRHETLHEAPGGASGTRLCILSRKECNCHWIAHFLYQNAIFCAHSVRNRPETDRDPYPATRLQAEILSRGIEKKTLRFGPIWPQQPLRYPIDTRPIPDFRSICSRFASQPDPIGSLLDRIGRLFAHLRIATAMATVAPSEFDPEFGTRRQCGPRRGAQLVQKAAGRISAALQSRPESAFRRAWNGRVPTGPALAPRR